MKLTSKVLKKIDKEYSMCDSCEDVKESFAFSFSSRDKNYCDDCLTHERPDGSRGVDGVGNCESCGDYFFTDELTEGLDKGLYCEECYTYHFVKLNVGGK